MAINVGALRTDAMKRRIKKFGAFTPNDLCELCWKPLADPDKSAMIEIDHENYQFVTPAEILARGDAVSLFPVGPDCLKKIKKALACE